MFAGRPFSSKCRPITGISGDGGQCPLALDMLMCPEREIQIHSPCCRVSELLQQELKTDDDGDGEWNGVLIKCKY